MMANANTDAPRSVICYGASLNPSSPRPPASGFVFALLAYTSWGLIPLYWKLFGRVSPIEIVSHRAIWSLLLLILLTLVLGQGEELLRVIRSLKYLLLMLLTATLLSINWGLFIYAVVTSQVVETSLGYFLNPLVSILLAFVFLKERLTRWQVVAVLLATCGVTLFGWALGRVPWIALGLAVSFGLYGLIRKIVAVGPLVGLLVETTFMLIPAVGLIALVNQHGEILFGSTTRHTLLFIGGGLITTIPLVLYNRAAKLLPLSTLGILQFLAPSLQLIVGVLIFHEPFTHREAAAFLLIWIAVAIYLITLLRGRQQIILAPDPD